MLLVLLLQKPLFINRKHCVCTHCFLWKKLCILRPLGFTTFGHITVTLLLLFILQEYKSERFVLIGVILFWGTLISYHRLLNETSHVKVPPHIYWFLLKLWTFGLLVQSYYYIILDCNPTVLKWSRVLTL